VSHALEVQRTRVVDYALSDHLPICVELLLPEGLRLAA
jgi:endonuclease/exonuclease/phosphatase family metal-dependent hydrolase